MAADLSPVETLRAAAERLRERGLDVFCGCADSARRWVLTPDPTTDTQVIVEAGCDMGAVGLVYGFRPDAGEWIALVHPGVAEPLADWLGTMADRYAHWEDPRRSPEFAHPYAVARVLLGVPDGV